MPYGQEKGPKEIVAEFYLATDEMGFHGLPVPVMKEVLSRLYSDVEVTYPLLCDIASRIRHGKLRASGPEYDEAWKKAREASVRSMPF